MKTLLLCLLATGLTAPAALIFSNGTVDTNAANARDITIFRTADDFTLASAVTLDSVRFWLAAEPGDFAGTLTYAIYQNAGGALGTVVNTATLNGVTPVLLNQIPQYIYSMYQVDFVLPVAQPLSAGTYWLEIHEGASLVTATQDLNVYWAVAGFGATGNAKQSSTPTLPSGATTSAMGFELYGSAAAPTTGVPEPGTWALCLAGLAAAAALRARTSASTPA